MKGFINIGNSINANQLYWFGIKLPLVLYWFSLIIKVFKNYTNTPLPTGVCKVVNCELFLNTSISVFILVIVAIAATLYLFERYMKWVTLFIFLCSILVFTVEESNGVLNRTGMYSFLFFAQSVAYWYNYFQKNSPKLNTNRIQYSIQVVGISYSLSGASKLIDSGLLWAWDGKRITLQILKSFYYRWASSGGDSFIREGERMVQIIEQNKNGIEALLWCALILELLAFTTAINIKYARIYGVCLLLMHIGISISMDIVIRSFVTPMVIVLINPVGLFLVGVQKFFNNKRL